MTAGWKAWTLSGVGLCLLTLGQVCGLLGDLLTPVDIFLPVRCLGQTAVTLLEVLDGLEKRHHLW